MPAAIGTDFTYTDLGRLRDDLMRHEILGGIHVVSPAPTPRHQLICMHLAAALRRLWDERRALVLCAPVDVKLGESDVVEPDIVAVAAERAGIVGPACIEGAPDLVVEVLSPSSRRRDRGDKRGLFEQAGVREYWIVDDEARVVTQLVLESGRFRETEVRDLLRSAAFPGWSAAVAPMFDSGAFDV